MKILVTGASGYIGKHLCNKLHKEGHDITKLANKNSGSDYKIVDITSYKSVKEQILGYDFVIHLACLSLPLCIKNPQYGHEVNVNGTNNIARACAEKNIKLLIVSSSEVYGNPKELPITENIAKKPISIYGNQKLLAENCCIYWSRKLGLRYSIIRLFNVFGPAFDMEKRNTVESIFIQNAMLQKNILINGGYNNSRDFLYIDDAIYALHKAIINFNEIQDKTLNIASGIETSLVDLAYSVCDIFNQSRDIVNVTYEGSSLRSQADISLAKSLINFEPKISITEGLKKIIKSWE